MASSQPSAALEVSPVIHLQYYTHLFLSPSLSPRLLPPPPPPPLSLSLSYKMHCDLLQWDQALQLAKTLSPSSIPQLSKQYAQQLEFM